jgi:hypothetical protein
MIIVKSCYVLENECFISFFEVVKVCGSVSKDVSKLHGEA